MSVDAIQDRVHSGKIRRTDLISKVADGPWKPITAVPALAKGKTNVVDSVSDLDVRLLRNPGIPLGTGVVLPCEECGEQFGRKEPECPFCGTGNSLVARTAGVRVSKRGNVLSFYQHYRQVFLILIWLTLGLATVVTVFVGYRVQTGGSDSVSGREQQKYVNRTTAMWIELAEQNRAELIVLSASS